MKVVKPFFDNEMKMFAQDDLDLLIPHILFDIMLYHITETDCCREYEQVSTTIVCVCVCVCVRRIFLSRL